MSTSMGSATSRSNKTRDGLASPRDAAVALKGVSSDLALGRPSQAIDPQAEMCYWRENYQTRLYFEKGKTFGVYEPAYRYGWESAANPVYATRAFEDVESFLARGWERSTGGTRYSWHQMRSAIRDAWKHVRSR